MPYQNINQYNFPKWYLREAYDLMDFSLASDEVDYLQEVVFSPYLIGLTDGNRLPIYFDLNNSNSSLKLNLTYKNYNTGNTIVSLNYYNPDNLDLNCFSSYTLCDIGLTGTDNGLVDQMTGETIYITQGLFPSNLKFDRYHFDRRFKMWQVTGYTQSPNHLFSGISANTLYEIISHSGGSEGYYNELYGGFYQGFFKLYGYDYETFPQRTNKGWSVEMLLRPRKFDIYSASTGETYLNEIYPNNKDIFFYFGTRAENKYYHYPSGVTESLSGCLKTCACSDTGVTNSRCIEVYPSTASTVTTEYNPCCSCDNITTLNIPEKDPKLDTISNALAFRLCGDNPESPNIGVRVLYFTGGCETTGSCSDTGITYTTGYTVVEYCSTRGIYDDCLDTAFVNGERWLQVDAVWERYKYLDDCDLFYRGGLSSKQKTEYLDSLSNESVLLIESPITHTGEEPETIITTHLTEKYLYDRDFRLGQLKIYVNGRIFFIINDFEEIIPRGLDTEKEKQIGVPFNISWGGGTQGLHENLVFSACPESLINEYIQDPQLFPNNILSSTTYSSITTNILLEQNFGGTFDGGISQFRMYTLPLTASEVKHNFKLLKNTFMMFDPDCPVCYTQCDNDFEVVVFETTPTPTPSITPTNTTTPTPTPTPTPTITPSSGLPPEPIIEIESGDVLLDESGDILTGELGP